MNNIALKLKSDKYYETKLFSKIGKDYEMEECYPQT